MLYRYKHAIHFFCLFVLLLGGVFYISSLDLVRASDSVTDLSKEKEAKEDELDAIKAKIKAYKQIVDLKTRQGSTLAEQIEGLQAQADKLQAELDLNKRQLNELETTIGTLTSRVAEKTLLIDRQKKMLSELMRAYYSEYSNDAIPLFLSSTESLLYFQNSDSTADVSDKVKELLDSVKTLRDSMMNEQALLDEKKKEVDATYTKLSERNDYLELTKDNKAALLAKTQAEATKYDQLVDKLQEERDALENEIEDLESGKVDDLDGLPSYRRGTLAYPVSKVSISQGYGKTKFAKKAYASGKHNGIDFTGSSGTSILAAANGKVVGTGNLGKYAYGRWIAIDHDNGIVTLYGHLSSVKVKTGDKVDEGDKIGGMGSSGYSTGTHLHFTVFSEKSYEVVPSKSVKGLRIPIGASVNPSVYLP